ncbi:hypothetical protein [Granulicoccus phenolivorans]|uniref:hypothetical protein n=1 Tax=Granulicoccus phenolivorans TaxID=266854 RepID=UPI0004795A03|nr:hypothetical protein [Granulicoccus phenolivorans]
MYLTGFASQAIDQVAKEVADLPPTRGFWDYTRAVINQMIGADPFGSPVQLLKANGLHWQPCGAPDRIRFRLIDCPQVITLRARPAEAPAPTPEGLVQDPLIPGLDDYANAQLVLWCDRDPVTNRLASTTLALGRGLDGGERLRLIEDIPIHLPGVAGASAPPILPAEDEAVFRGKMARRDSSETAGEVPAAYLVDRGGEADQEANDESDEGSASSQNAG